MPALAVHPLAPRRVLLLAGMLAGLSFPAWCSAEIYGYVDSFGNFTYSNLPPPKDARVTDVIAEEPPVSAKALAEATQQARLDEANERIRLLELEQLHQTMQVADYPAPQLAPEGAGCNPGDSYDCSDLGPYYGAGGLVYGRHFGYARARGYRGPSRGGVAPSRGARASVSQGGGSGARAR